jgi:hypothetical protein
MAAVSKDKALIIAGLALVIVSAGFFGTLVWRHVGLPVGAAPTVELASAPYEATAPSAPPVKTETWAAPVAQTRGREWIYDTFTPPEIFYNARSKQFTVKPPSSLVDEEAQEVFGVELVSVRPEPYRLQLIGFAGGEGHWRGTFQIVKTGEVFLGTTGKTIPALSLAIKSLDVSLQPVRVGENTTTKQLVATAVIHDEKSGRDVTLTHRERAFTGTLSAFVAAAGESATREVRQGDIFKIGEATYKIEKVLNSPPSVEVVKESSTLSQPDRRVLLPREPDEPEREAGT